MEINLHRISLFLATMLYYSVLQSCAFRSDYVYVESTGSYYKFHRDPANWDDANSRCQSEGAVMFHPENKDELVQALRAAKVEMDKGWHIGSGFSNLRKGYFFETVEGYPICYVYDNWGKDQPERDSHCGGFNVTSLTIFVHDCSSPFVFMCKHKPKNKTVTTNALGAFRTDYGYVESTGSYYKFHRDPANWNDSISRCQSEGAIMFHPESKDELVQALRAANASTDWNIASGFSDLRKNGFYETVEGYPISHVYDNWHEYYPDSDHCGALAVTSLKIYTVDCSYPRVFMCKFKPINETVTKTTEKANTVLEKLAAFLEQPSGEMQRQAAFQTAALERMAEAMQRQASTLEKMAGAFSSALHLLTAP